MRLLKKMYANLIVILLPPSYSLSQTFNQFSVEKKIAGHFSYEFHHSLSLITEIHATQTLNYHQYFFCFSTFSPLHSSCTHYALIQFSIFLFQNEFEPENFETVIFVQTVTEITLGNELERRDGI